MTYEQIQAVAATISSRTQRTHQVALVLGSGLSEFGADLAGGISMPYSELGLPLPSVEGHGGELVSVQIGGVDCLLFRGRVHFYEGRSLAEVVSGVRVAVAAGCVAVVLTNAAGGAGDGLFPGDLVLISDHLNLSGHNPLQGPNDARLGPRFPDLTDLYDAQLRNLAIRVSKEVGVALKGGVYAWLSGPSYETPAEIQMARRLGADLVGMSTVPEAIAVRHMGGRVLGISLVTNLAAGISPVPLSHEEVTATAAAARSRFTRLLLALLPRLGRPD